MRATIQALTVVVILIGLSIRGRRQLRGEGRRSAMAGLPQGIQRQPASLRTACGLRPRSSFCERSTNVLPRLRDCAHGVRPDDEQCRPA